MIYCDLDGVAANFNQAIYELFNKKFDDDCTPIGYDCEQVLGVTTHDFWNKIDSCGEDFWVNIKPYSWMEELIDMIEEKDNWCFLTAPPLSHYAGSGKIIWFQKYFGKHFKDYIITPYKNKKLLSNKDSVLIDDRDKNCEDFEKSGGIAITFPQRWNKNHEIKNRMEYVQQELNKIYNCK